jgi:IS1 family transposase
MPRKSAPTPRRSTASWSLFPPETREGQLDERWAFVGKKEAHCGPDETEKGDNWDFVALDPVNRLVVSFVPGKRNKAQAEALVEDFHRRTGGRPMFITSDEYKPYIGAVLKAYGEEFTPPRPRGPGRPPKARLVAPEGLVYATVHKTRRNGRVVDVRPHLVFGTAEELVRALETSPVSDRVNTAFIERENGTSRLFNARKARKTYQFSKDWDIHEGVGWFEIGAYNFCWTVETLTLIASDGTRTRRSPALAAGLTDHVWTLEEWVKFPAAVPLDSG